MIWRTAVLALTFAGNIVAAAELPFQTIPAFSAEAQAVREAAAMRQDAERLQEAGRAQEAREKWLAAIEAYRRADYPLGEVELLFQVGASYQSDFMSNPEAMTQAAEHFRQGMVVAGSYMGELASRVDRGPLREPDQLFRSASQLAAEGNCADAVPLFAEAGQKYGQAGSAAGELRSLTGRLRCQPPMDDPLSAMGVLTAVLDFQRIGDRLQGTVDAGPWMRYLRAVEDLAFGRWLIAEGTLHAALGEFERLGDARHAALAALDLGGLLAAKGQRDEAGALYRRADQLLAGLRTQDDLRNRRAARRNLAGLSALTALLPTTRTPPPPETVAEESPPVEDDPIALVHGLNLRAQERRRAAFLLGDGDRLHQAGRLKEARTKWRAAAEAAERADDSLKSAEAYRRLAFSSIPQGVSRIGPQPEAVDYLARALAAHLDFLEPMARKRWPGEKIALAEADDVVAEADSLLRSGSCQQALPRLADARNRYRDAGFAFGELRSLLLRLRCLTRPGDALAAAMTLFEALPMFQALLGSDAQEELEDSAETLASGGQLLAAKTLYGELLCRAERTRDADAVARSLVGLARVQLELGETTAAEAGLQRALGLLPFVDDERGEVRAGEAHERLGDLRFAQGREEEGREEYRIARELIQRAGDPEREVISLYRLAMELADSGDSVKALSILEEAEALQRRLSADPEVEGDLLVIRGSVQFFQGKLQEALGSFFGAEQLYAQEGSALRRALGGQFISAVQGLLGRETDRPVRDTAETGRSAGLELVASIDDIQQLWALFQAGRFAEAAALARKNVSYWREAGNQDGEALARAMLAACEIELGNRENAEREIGAVEALQSAGALGKSSGPMRGLIANLTSLIKIKLEADRVFATARQEAGGGEQLDGQRARQLLDELGGVIRGQLQPLQSATGKLSLSAINVGGMGSIERLIAGDPVGALADIGRSISTVEQWGRGLTVNELRAPFYDRLSQLLAVGVDVSRFAGRPDEAFRRAEEARARAFIDQLGNQKIDPGRKGDPEMVKRERQLRLRLADLKRKLREEQQKALADQSRERLENLQYSLEQAGREWDELRIRLKITNPEYADLVHVEPLDLEEVQTQVLDRETTLLEYFVSGSDGDHVLAWVIDHDRFDMIRLQVAAGDLRDRVKLFRSSIESRQPVQSLSAELYRDLFAPLAPHVRHRNLVIVPHGVLHFLPFAALWDGKRYLGDAFALSYAPSATALKFAREKTARAVGPILAVGDPDGSLQHAATEARAVARRYGSEPLLGPEAKEGAVVSRAGRAGLLHLAAHAVLNPVNPLFTRIELAPDGEHDGNLEMHEVYGLDLSWTGLVVLSGCRTQMGRLTAGDEIEGLTRAFLYAGTPAVMSSLWDVQDESTSFLMERFYTHLRRGKGRAEALRRAQAETRRRFPHPYHWAAFVLTGDGR